MAPNEPKVENAPPENERTGSRLWEYRGPTGLNGGLQDVAIWADRVEVSASGALLFENGPDQARAMGGSMAYIERVERRAVHAVASGFWLYFSEVDGTDGELTSSIHVQAWGEEFPIL